MTDGVVTVLLEYLSGRLEEEANFLDGVEDKVSSLHGELRLINIFLKNSEGKRNDEIVKEIVRQIREVAYEAEDVIDTFILKVAEHRRRSRIGRILRLPSHAKMLRTVGRKITNIQEKINKIYNNKERYGIERVEATTNAIEEEAMHRRRREVEEDEVVGFVDDTATLVKQLTDGDRKLSVISIIGMGGLGKTTLARKLYNNRHVQSHFNCFVWVCVSQDFRTRELLNKISKVLGVDTVDKSDNNLRSELFQYLKGKRYLVVMDDIWRTEVWDEVSSAFPNNSNTSRILITSRNKEVALHANPSLHPYSLPFLDRDESWELFKKKVFRGEICPPELEILGKQIAKGCHGLPLSIVVLAGILANKEKSIHMWSKFVGHVTSFLTREEDTTICQKILSLSYTDLPQRLKPCFLYFGIYPEDFEIPVRDLMHLWVAEGFVQHTDHRFQEDVAEIYLEELIDRSLIQATSRRTDGGVKKCRIHDILRELCLSKSAEETFLGVHSAYHQSTNKSRRLSIQGDSLPYMSLNTSVTTYARSLFLFGEGFEHHVCCSGLLKNFKLVRVLNFWRVKYPAELVKSIATFIHLRYLTIEICGDNVFPNSIGNLTNLETLHVSGGLVKPVCLPKEIFKLQRLRNLYITPYGWLNPCDLKEGLGNLQVLSVAKIIYDPQKHSLPVVLGKFTNVRKLKILIYHPKAPLRERRKANEEEVYFPDLHHLRHLEILRIGSTSPMLLPGDLNSIPSKITKLTLHGVVLKVGGVTVLGKHPNLRILKLERDYGSIHDDPESIHVIADLFPRLEMLKLQYLRIREWKHERGAMPCLGHLVIRDCDEFTSPPQLLSLSTLRYVEVKQSPRLATMFRVTELGFKLIEQSYGIEDLRMVRVAGGSQAQDLRRYIS